MKSSIQTNTTHFSRFVKLDIESFGRKINQTIFQIPMADKEPNTVLDVQKVKRIKELPNGNAIFSGWVHLAREDDQAGGCGSFSETLRNFVKLGRKRILF